MHDLYIAEIYRPGAIFLPLTVGLRVTQRAAEKSYLTFFNLPRPATATTTTA